MISNRNRAILNRPLFGICDLKKHWLKSTKHIYRCKTQWCVLQRLHFYGIRTCMNFPQLFRSKPYVFSMVYVFFITYVMCSSFGVIFTADLKCQILVACDLKSQFVFAVICNRWDTCGDYVLHFTYTLTLCCFCIVILLSLYSIIFV